MLDWMNRKVEKTETEKEYDKLKAEYFEAFEEEYPSEWGISDMKKEIAEMKECLKLGILKKPKGFDTSGGKLY